MTRYGRILRTWFALGLSLCLVAAQPAPQLLTDLNTAPSPEGSFPVFGAALPDGSIVFAARRSTEGLELWLLSANGASLIKDIEPGPEGSNPRGFVRFGSLVYFTANNGTHGSELWRTDGTAQGTIMVVDLEPGASGSLPSELVVGPGALYFRAFTAAHGSELWKTDGTAAGTLEFEVEALVRSLSSAPRELTLAGADEFFFVANVDGLGTELCFWNGQSVVVHDIAAGAVSSSPQHRNTDHDRGPSWPGILRDLELAQRGRQADRGGLGKL